MNQREYVSHLKMTDKARQALLDRLDDQARQGNERVGNHAENLRKDKRWVFRQAGIPFEVDHPGGTVSRLLVASRNLSAGGFSFMHGGYLHPDSTCRLVLRKLDGTPVPISGQIASCRHLQGSTHEIGVRFLQRVEPSDFMRLDDADAMAAKSGEAIYSSLDADASMVSMIEDFLNQSNRYLDHLQAAIAAEKVKTIREICHVLQGAASGYGFEVVSRAAADAICKLDANNSTKDSGESLDQLMRMIKAMAVKPRETE